MSGISSSQMSAESLDDYGLGGVNCDICHNSGIIVYQKDGQIFSRDCECMAKRRSMRRIRNSGMEDMLERYTFDNYQAIDEAREKIKEKALEYVNSPDGWMYVAGRSGSGKTHICTAVCKALIDSGREVYYMNWKDESTSLKSLVTDNDEYQKRMDKIKTVPILYIDDFLKGGSNGADVKLAFEILNSRYNNRKLRTVISSEFRLKGLFEIDEAVAGRIYERAKGFWLVTPNENWRYREVLVDAKEMKEASRT